MKQSPPQWGLLPLAFASVAMTVLNEMRSHLLAEQP
jgi:hypothetical protein